MLNSKDRVIFGKKKLFSISRNFEGRDKSAWKWKPPSLYTTGEQENNIEEISAANPANHDGEPVVTADGQLKVSSFATDNLDKGREDLAASGNVDGESDSETVGSGTITRTSRYCPVTGGFVTEVVSNVLELSAEEPVRTESSVLSRCSHTPSPLFLRVTDIEKGSGLPHLHRSDSTSSNLLNDKEDFQTASSDATMTLSMAQVTSSSQSKGTAALVSHHPNYVTNIVSSQGNLMNMGSKTVSNGSLLTSNSVPSKLEKSAKLGASPAPLLTKHENYVTNIEFGSIRTKAGAAAAISGRTIEDSSSMPDPSIELMQQAKLQSHILEAKLEDPSFTLSATVLDKVEDDLANLYKTISRKKILSKVQFSNFNPHDDSPQANRPFEEGNENGDIGKDEENINNLARIISRISSQSMVENAYSSLLSDNLYTSIGKQDNNISFGPQFTSTDRFNSKDLNNNGHHKQGTGSNRQSSLGGSNHNSNNRQQHCCGHLITALANSQAEARTHAMTGCGDCIEYSSALHTALGAAVNQPHRQVPCQVHGYVDAESVWWPLPSNRRGITKGKDARIVCYLAGVIIALLALVVVIVVLTMMVAHQEMEKDDLF